MHHRAPRDDRDVASLAHHPSATERQHVVIARVSSTSVAGHQQRAMLEEDRGVRASHRGPQQAHRVARIGRDRDLPAVSVREAHLVAETVPRIAHVLAEATRHPHHHWRGEPIGRSPAQRPGVVELLGRRVGVLAELDLGDRHQPADREPRRASDDPLLGKTRVEHAVGTELLLQPLGDQMHTAFLADILAEHDEPGVDGELVLERSPDRFGEAQQLAIGARGLRTAERSARGPRKATERLRRTIAIVGVDVLRDPRHVWHGARSCRDEPALHIARDLHLQRAPLGRAEQCGHEVLAQSRQRVARLVAGDLGVAAVALLVVGTGVTREAWHREVHQRRSGTAAHLRHALGEQARGHLRVRAVAITDEEVGERREVLRDVAARRLHLPLHRDAEVVVLDVEEHRELQCRCHRERRPEAVGRHRAIAAECDTERALPARVVERVAMVGDGLGPAGGRRELRADVPRHREHHGAVRVGQVADDADVSTVGEAARTAQRRTERVVEWQAE